MMIILLMIAVLTGTGFGVSLAVRHSIAAVTREPGVSQLPMVPANFSELAEKVRPGVVNLQVVKKVENIGLSSRNLPGLPFGGKIPLVIFLGHFFKEIRQRGTNSGALVRGLSSAATGIS